MLVTDSGYRDEIQTQHPFSWLASKIWLKDKDKSLAPDSSLSAQLTGQKLSSWFLKKSARGTPGKRILREVLNNLCTRYTW